MQDLKIKELCSNHCDQRPAGCAVDTLIIHSIHHPDSEDCFSAQSCKSRLDDFGVSAHYLIDLVGIVWKLVDEEKRAWHAGKSKMPRTEDSREAVNDFSIGIELIGSEDTEFTEAQYISLIALTKDIFSRHKIKNIYGHSDIAPDRKTDPWGFEWVRYRNELLESTESCNNIYFNKNAIATK